MSNALKCPNPSCPYQFDPSRVPAGVVLTCPRCAMRFTLGPPATSAPGAAPPQPPAPPPASAPEPAFPPVDTRPTRPTVRRRQPARGGSNPLQTAVLVIVAFAMLAGVGAVVYFRLFHKRGGPGETATELQDRNVTFDPPPAPWVRDDDLRAKLAERRAPVVVAYKRAEPDAVMAFGARDFETRNPRVSELRDGLMLALGNVLDDVRPTDIPNARWMGQPAQAFEFLARGKRDGPTVVGECHAVSYKGIGYWSICWAGENDAKDQAPTFEATRGSFKLLLTREKWAPKESTVRPFGGHKLRYRLLDVEGIWTEPDAKDEDPKSFDPNADLLLRPLVKKKPDLRAALVVLILDPSGDEPLAQGRKHVQDQWTADVKAGNVTPQFTELTGEPEGDPSPNAVEPTAPVVRLHGMVPGASGSRLMVVSAIAMGERVVVASAWCPWADRAQYERTFMQMAGSLRESK